MSKIKDIGIELQESGALRRVNSELANSTTKLLYTIVVEDPTAKTECRLFATSKVDKSATFCEVIGYEITGAQSSKLKTWNDVIELATKSQLDLVNMTFPWHRVINIKNVSYKAKAQ